MQKGLKTRLIIHDILKILKNHKSTLDQILINKVDNNFSSSDRNMIMSVVLTSMRHNFLIEKGETIVNINFLKNEQIHKFQLKSLRNIDRKSINIMRNKEISLNID